MYLGLGVFGCIRCLCPLAVLLGLCRGTDLCGVPLAPATRCYNYNFVYACPAKEPVLAPPPLYLGGRIFNVMMQCQACLYCWFHRSCGGAASSLSVGDWV
jgi:hypothetical protein